MKVSIGCDPEFFLYDTKKKMYVSAHDLVPGTKKEPFKLKKGAVQVDGTSVEFNINPAQNCSEFVSNILVTLDEIRKMIPKKYAFKFQPCAYYEKEYYESLPEEVKMLGCDPDFNAFKDGAENPTPKALFVNNTYVRTGAGHIHIGWGKNLDTKDVNHLIDCCFLTKLLEDSFYPLYRSREAINERTKMYGKPGTFRPKSYGLEYRTPSNYWLNSVVTMIEVYKATEYVMEISDKKEPSRYFVSKAGYAMEGILAANEMSPFYFTLAKRDNFSLNKLEDSYV